LETGIAVKGHPWSSKMLAVVRKYVLPVSDLY